MKINKKTNRSKGHGIITGFLKLFIKKPKIMYLGEQFKDSSLILSNHAGKSAPLSLDIYLKIPFRFWGTYEMNSGIKSLYKYQTEIFYHQKKKWNLGLARIACCLISPLTNMYYRGLNLISTYPDSRLRKTIKESVETLKSGQSIVVFPEDSSQGYFDEMKYYFSGFLLLAETCYKKGLDLPIYVTYFRKKDKKYIVDKPILYSELIKTGLSRNEIANNLRIRTNELKDLEI